MQSDRCRHPIRLSNANPSPKMDGPDPAKLSFNRRFCPFGSDRSLEPTTERTGCRDQEHIQVMDREHVSSTCEKNRTRLGPSSQLEGTPATTRMSRAGLSGFSSNPKRDGLETGSSDAGLDEQTTNLVLFLDRSLQQSLRVSRRMSRMTSLPIPYEGSQESPELP